MQILIHLVAKNARIVGWGKARVVSAGEKEKGKEKKIDREKLGKGKEREIG